MKNTIYTIILNLLRVVNLFLSIIVIIIIYDINKLYYKEIFNGKKIEYVEQKTIYENIEVKILKDSADKILINVKNVDKCLLGVRVASSLSYDHYILKYNCYLYYSDFFKEKKQITFTYKIDKKDMELDGNIITKKIFFVVNNKIVKSIDLDKL